MATILLGIGSNIQPQQHIPAGVLALQGVFAQVTWSRVYQSPAVGFDGADFYNLVLRAQTEQSPQAVVAHCKAIEAQFGKANDAPKFSSRNLDIDLLLYDDWVSHGALDVPRAEICENAFVLRPLAELEPTRQHPTLALDLASLWSQHPQFAQGGELKALPDDWLAQRLAALL